MCECAGSCDSFSKREATRYLNTHGLLCSRPCSSHDLYLSCTRACCPALSLFSNAIVCFVCLSPLPQERDPRGEPFAGEPGALLDVDKSSGRPRHDVSREKHRRLPWVTRPDLAWHVLPYLLFFFFYSVQRHWRSRVCPAGCRARAGLSWMLR